MSVYFIKDEHTGFVKIGFSDKPEHRLKSLQTSSPNKLSLVGTVAGDKELEFVLHTTFAEHKVRGEWFSLPSVSEAIDIAEAKQEERVSPDLLPLVDAARVVGKSVDTLRRWKRAGLLTFEGLDEKGRALVRVTALRNAARDHARDTAPNKTRKKAATLSTAVDLKAVVEDSVQAKEAAKRELEELRARHEEAYKSWEAERKRLVEDRDLLIRQRDELAKKTSLPKLLVYALRFHKEGKL